MRIRNTNPTTLATGAMYCAPYGGADPFSPNSGTDPNNIFNQAAQRQQQQSNTMPNGMQQQPPQSSTNPNYNRQDQQFSQTGITGNQGDDPNDALVNQGGGSGNGQGGSPLDKYRSNGDNDNQGQGGQQANGQKQQQQQQQQQQQEVDYFNVGADKYHQLFQQQDFTKGIDQEVVGKALEGDTESFMQVLNTVARNAASGSSYLSSQVASKGVSSKLDKFGQDVPKMVRDQAVNEMFANNKNKFYTDPAMQPMVSAVRDMVTKQNPNATAQQIQQEVELVLKEAMGGFGGAFAGDESKNKDADDGQDMSALFG